MSRPWVARWQWLFTHLAGLRLTLLGVVLATTPLALIGIISLALVRRIFDVAIPHGDSRAIVVLGLSLFALRIGQALALLAVNRWAVPILKRANAGLRAGLFQELSLWRWADILELDAGVAEARIVYETEQLDQLVGNIFLTYLPAAITLLVYAAIMAAISPYLLAVAAGIGVLVKALSWPLTRTMKRATIRFRNAFETYHVITRRQIALLPTSVAQASEGASRAAFVTGAESLAGAGAGVAMSGSVVAQADAIGSALVAVTVLTLGAIGVAQHSLTVGAFAAFLVAASQANGAANSLTRAVPALMNGDEALARLANLRGKGWARPAGGPAQPDFSRPIQLRDICLSYGPHRVLDGANMDVVPGRITAIVGPSGRGKTSLLNLIMGLIPPDSGTIGLGAAGLPELDLQSYRRQIGYLPQHPFLFGATISDNILAGRDLPDSATMATAIAEAVLAPVVDAAPQGLETVLADNGHKLSGGERQRLILARALAGAPRLLVLDEPTNHMDQAIVAALVETLFGQGRAPRTVLVATHDPRVIAAADIVYDLVNGELLRRDPVTSRIAS